MITHFFISIKCVYLYQYKSYYEGQMHTRSETSVKFLILSYLSISNISYRNLIRNYTYSELGKMLTELSIT